MLECMNDNSEWVVGSGVCSTRCSVHVVNINTRRSVSRRLFLRGTGAAAIGLPLLEAMQPTLGQRLLGAGEVQVPRRFVAICGTLGFHAPFFFPEKPGKDYKTTPYLAKLKDHRDQITIFSGLSHPNQQGNNGHASEMTWLTSAQRPGLAGFRNTISLDQLIAEKIGMQTRYPFLALSTSGRSMSWTANGVPIPGVTSPAKLYTALFVDGTKKEISAELARIRRGKSILDTVRDRAKELKSNVGSDDREKIEQYLAAVRDLEIRLQQSEGWVTRPKPKIDVPKPQDVANRNDAIGRQKLLYDMIVLALQTDSTRTVTFQLSGMNAVPVIDGVRSDWHGLSHHGKDPKKIDELKIIELAEFETFGKFLTSLRKITEQGRSLLDSTAVLFGSNLGNASSHSWKNLPIMVVGGGYRHGQYVAHDSKSNTPLANLFVSLAQRMGLEVDRFGSSTAESVDGLVRR